MPADGRSSSPRAPEHDFNRPDRSEPSDPPSIAALLNQHPDLEVVAGASGADTSELKKAKPQVVLLDLRLGHKDSLRIAEQVKKEFPDSKVIVMDLLPVHEDIVQLVR